MLSYIHWRPITLAFLILINGVAISPSSHGASFYDLVPGGTGTNGYMGWSIGDRGFQPDLSFSTSAIISSIPPEGGGKQWGLRLCESVDASSCQSGDGIKARLILPPCETQEDRMCIESLELGKSVESLKNAKLDHEIDGPRTPASQKYGIPAGGSPSLWHSEALQSQGIVSKYGVIVQVNYFQNKVTIGGQRKLDEPFNFESMKIEVFPVDILKGDYYPLRHYKALIPSALDDKYEVETFSTRPTNPITDWQSNFKRLSNSCVWTEFGYCAQRIDFPEESRVKLKLRVRNEMTGWLFGRLKDVKLQVQPLDGAYNGIAIEGSPINEPKAYGFVKKSELRSYPEIDSYVRKSFGDSGYTQALSNPGTYFSESYSLDENFDWLRIFEPVLQSWPNTLRRWSISSGYWDGKKPEIPERCFQDKSKLMGLVSTNALLYEPGPPRFQNGELNYRVGGVHFQSDGKTLSRGTYDLVIRAEAARCIYGFSGGKVQASISVVNSDGSEQTAVTESFKEDSKGDWLFFSAQNFTFSSPTIRIKMSQVLDQPSQPRTEIGDEGNQNLESKKTFKSKALNKFTCVRGKIVKKPISGKSVCPKGFSKRY